MNAKIVSIASAQPGWSKVYGLDDGTVDRLPIVCWALVQHADGHQVVLPLNLDDSMKGRVLSPEEGEAANYLGVDYPGCEIDWSASAKAHLGGGKVKGR